MLQQRGRAVIDAIRLPSANARERARRGLLAFAPRVAPLRAHASERERKSDADEWSAWVCIYM